MEPREAFFLGYLTSYVGIPFRGMDIMNAVGHGASAPLVARISAQADALRAKNPETIDSVMRVEALLGKHGLPRPPRPQTLQEWVVWCGEASRTAGAATTPETETAAALSAGGFFGDLLAAVQLGVIIQGLLEVEPSNAVLQTQAIEHAKLAAQSVDRLELVLRHPGLPAKAKAPLGASVAAYRHAPGALPALKTKLNQLVPALDDAF
jgi:hypothetical protein